MDDPHTNCRKRARALHVKVAELEQQRADAGYREQQMAMLLDRMLKHQRNAQRCAKSLSLLRNEIPDESAFANDAAVRLLRDVLHMLPITVCEKDLESIAALRAAVLPQIEKIQRGE